MQLGDVPKLPPNGFDKLFCATSHILTLHKTPIKVNIKVNEVISSPLSWQLQRLV